ncbi:hypothetical protein DFH08DRAFT_799783 [Mycena albidolilacea]|uniref:Uncharacterized protein n=1 Tax=Mycena albidolilacea TaxID=1033008 RepID=A0AAD7AM15_9AGAR|nr:hypothetical protein DFH08DRAFT_799783 [Mycena albidolilacea]
MSEDQIPGVFWKFRGIPQARDGIETSEIMSEEHIFYLTNNKINGWKTEDAPKSRSFVYIGTCGTNSESGPSLRGNKRPGRQFFNTVKQIRGLEAQGKVGTAWERTAARRAHRVKMTQAEVLQGAGNAGESRDAQCRKAGAHGRKGGGEDKILDQMQGGYGEHRSVSQKASPEVVEVLGKAGAKHRKSTAPPSYAAAMEGLEEPVGGSKKRGEGTGRSGQKLHETCLNPTYQHELEQSHEPQDIESAQNRKGGAAQHALPTSAAVMLSLPRRLRV